jgi:hypothetical protein
MMEVYDWRGLRRMDRSSDNGGWSPHIFGSFRNIRHWSKEINWRIRLLFKE